VTIQENATSILEETEKLFGKGMAWPTSALVDPSTTYEDGKSGVSKNIYNLYLEAGLSKISLRPAARQKVMDRVERMRDLLRPDPAKRFHPISGEEREGGWPTLIFTEDCDGDIPVNGIKAEGGTITEFEEWELRDSSSSKKNPGESPQELNDHGPDAVSYAIQVYYGAVSNAEEEPVTRSQRENDPQERLKKSIYERLENDLSPKKVVNSTLQGSEY